MDQAWYEHGDALNCVTDLPGPTNGFRRRVRRMDGVGVTCRVFQPRWHGFARYEVSRQLRSESGVLLERLESGWVWRGRRAPFYEFGPTTTEIHGDVLIDNGDTSHREAPWMGSDRG